MTSVGNDFARTAQTPIVNEVDPFDDRSFKSDPGVRRFVQRARERGIPVLREFDHTLDKPLYLISDWAERP